MRWEDEPFIKWYTRPTPEFLALSIGARGLLPLICSVVDRAGVLKVGKLGLKGIAVALHCAWVEIETYVQELAEDERIVFDAERGAVLIPNHIEAQAASQSDVARQRRSRETARAIFGGSGVTSESARRLVTKRDDVESQNVIEVSRPVTSGHVESRPVTLEETRSDEIRQTTMSALPTETGVRKRPGLKPDAVDEIHEHYLAVRKRHRPKTRIVSIAPADRKALEAKLKSGLSVADMKLACDGLFLSPHHTGQNDRETEYIEFKYVIKNAETFIALAEKDPALELNFVRSEGPRPMFDDLLKSLGGP